MKVSILETIENWRKEIPKGSRAREGDAVTKGLAALEAGHDFRVARVLPTSQILKVAGDEFKIGATVTNDKARKTPNFERYLVNGWLVPLDDQLEASLTRATRENVVGESLDPMMIELRGLLTDRTKAFDHEMQAKAEAEKASAERHRLDKEIRALEKRLTEAFEAIASDNGTDPG